MRFKENFLAYYCTNRSFMLKNLNSLKPNRGKLNEKVVFKTDAKLKPLLRSGPLNVLLPAAC